MLKEFKTWHQVSANFHKWGATTEKALFPVTSCLASGGVGTLRRGSRFVIYPASVEELIC